MIRTVGSSALLSLFIVAGCSSIGDAPSGPSPEEAKQQFQSLPLDEQIKKIEASPATPEQKKQLIEDAKKRAGQK